jgi:hypothetical protein
MRLKVGTRKELFGEASKRYQKAGKKEKSKILDELTENTGGNRKYLLHILANWGKAATVLLDGKTVKLKATMGKRRKGGGRKPVYTDEFSMALKNIWVFFWYRCGKILVPFMREHIQFLEKPFRLTQKTKNLLLQVSPATVDRLLKADKKKLSLKGKSGTKPGKLLKKQIPVRTYYAEADKKPGFFETDTLYHCGATELGEFCLTLTATDVCSGWVELRPTLNKAHKWVYQGLGDIKASLPFPFLGMDSDNGAEFINYALLKWAATEGIQFTRSRPYRKNDNCYVEQKNFACVRNIVGYHRFASAAECAALEKVYRSLCPLLNYFIPTQKLLSKTRVGSSIKKVYDKNIIAPYQRLLASPDLADEFKAELTRRFERYNPVALQQEVHDAVAALMSLSRTRNLEEVETLANSALQAI